MRMLRGYYAKLLEVFGEITKTAFRDSHAIFKPLWPTWTKSCRHRFPTRRNIPRPPVRLAQTVAMSHFPNDLKSRRCRRNESAGVKPGRVEEQDQSFGVRQNPGQ